MKRELLQYLEAGILDAMRMKSMGRDTMKQCIEFGLDLKLHGTETDNVGKTCQRELFVSLDRAYLRCGRRFGDLTFKTNGEVDWAVSGHFPIELQTEGADRAITVRCKRTNSRIRVPAELLEGHQGPYTVDKNFSISLACLTSASIFQEAGTPLVLKGLFPQLRRPLRPRSSEVEGAVATDPGA